MFWRTKSLCKTLSICVALLTVGVCWSALPKFAFAQLSDEMRELFEDIKGEYDQDIQDKINAAIRKNTDKVTFSTDEFRRFRANEINPFEGLDEIDLDSLDGSIQLKFEVPTVRNRRVGNLERQNPGFLNELSGVVGTHSNSIVEILNDNKKVCLGTVIDTYGTILTKASEIQGLKDLKIRDYQGVRFSAAIQKKDRQNDIALLKTSATHLPAIVWYDEQPALGDFLITPTAKGKVISFGSYSHNPRSLANSEKGFLGVTPRNAPNGVELTEVTPDSAADKAGLAVGDVIVVLNRITVTDVAGLVARIQSAKAGDTVEIEYLRNGSKSTTQAVLAGRQLSSDRAARFKMMNRLGAIPSERAQDFPWVFQHDSPLYPEECGGPIFDLEGKAIGINIARQGRVSSLGLPARHIKTLLDDLRREDVAAKNDN